MGTTPGAACKGYSVERYPAATAEPCPPVHPAARCAGRTWPTIDQ